jgi:hypothetical protein
MRKVLSIVIIILLTVFIGCKKDETSTSPTTTTTAVPQVSFKGPNTASTDMYVTMTKGYVDGINGLMQAGTLFTGVAGTQVGNTYTWTTVSDNLTVTLTATKQSDGSTNWAMSITGVYSNKSYTNFKIWDGYTSADGKNGNWKIYEPGHTNYDELIYTTDANNVLTGTYSSYLVDGTLDHKWVVVNNADASGRVEEYGNANGTKLSYKAVWAANGSGTWYIYNSSGVQTSTGTWQ